MASKKSAGIELVAVVSFAVFCLVRLAHAVEIPPTPTAHYYGDADGNVSLNLSDIAQHNAYTSFRPCAYDTLQPQTGGQYWNTCDVDGNRSCNLSDIAILNSYMSFKPVNLGGDPWVLENVNLPLSGNAANTWLPFNINLYMTYSGAPSGRPGISVIAEIDPTSPGHGQLSGRSCTPVGGTRDQLAPADAQCALAVTITDWEAGQEGLGLTESGANGLKVWGNGDGNLTLNIRIEAFPAMDIPGVTLGLDVAFSPECNDGIDNDGDTFSDYPDDPECSSLIDPTENNWVEVGAGSASGGGISNTNNSGGTASPSLALDSNGYPVVAWEDNNSGNYEIYVKRFDGLSWVEVGAGSSTGGGISNSSGISWTPSLALDSFGYPVVAWHDYSSGIAQIYIKRWDGGAWVDIGPGSSSGGGISNASAGAYNPSLALDSSSYPVVAWSCNQGIYVKRWDGNAWVDIGTGSSSGGGISNSIGSSIAPSLMLDSSDYPVVAWMDNSPGDWEIYIKRWNGIEWVDVGAGSSSGGGISNSGAWSVIPSLALDSTGNPCVAWCEDFDRDMYCDEIFIKRYTGGVWMDIGTGSSSGGGISNNSGYSSFPSLALDSSGYPVVAWDDSSSGNYEIYIKRWDPASGGTWVNIGTGSSSGGGISNNSGASYLSSLALNSSNNPVVAWADNTPGHIEIYIRQWAP